jgi:hypothetical protein
LLTDFFIDGDIDGPEGPLLSWRAMWITRNAPMLPLPDRTKPWDSGSNRFLSESLPSSFCDRGDPHTRILAIRGEDAVFDKSIGGVVKVPPSAIDTILLVEVHANTFIWTQPGDVAASERVIQEEAGNLPRSVLSSQKYDYFIAFADGSVWLISRKTPLNVLERFLTISNASQNDRDIELAPYRIKIE